VTVLVSGDSVVTYVIVVGIVVYVPLCIETMVLLVVTVTKEVAGVDMIVVRTVT